MKSTLLGLIVIGLSVVPKTGTGQDTTEGWDIFSSDSVLELSLLLDMDSLLADTGEDPSYHEAVLIYPDPIDNEPVGMKINVRARGNFRKNPANCDFPPLKLRFEKTDREGSFFNDIRDLKLVTHCQDNAREFEQYVLQEYLLYKAYNIFTDFSFRVRLVRITYVDMPERSDSITRFAFLLENDEDMAERNHGELLEIDVLSEDQLDRDYFTLMSVFNYMILNTDYSVPIVHNIELVSVDHFKPPVPVPYDFDWSGMINIPYDSPLVTNKTRYTRRIYKGPCLKRKEFETVFARIMAERERLYELYSDFLYLDEEFKVRSKQELDMFFIIIGSREQIREEFIKNCKK